MNSLKRCVVIGAGPAGLTAAYDMIKRGLPALVLEQHAHVGGLSRTLEYRGYRFDVGGHRFFTKSASVQRIWTEILGCELLLRPRLSRIHYRSRFFHYPLRPLNVLAGLGPIESLHVLGSYLRASIFPAPEEINCEQWISNRFGKRLFQVFFQTYTEKVWGMPASQIGSDWAAQRVKDLNLKTAVLNALSGAAMQRSRPITSLIDSFYYPCRGSGTMWERCADLLTTLGVDVLLRSRVVRLNHESGRVVSSDIANEEGAVRSVSGTHFLSSIPIRTLINALEPAPPSAVLDAARRLRYRDFVIVLLIVDQAVVFPDNWLYIHSPDVKAARIQNWKNWSPDMVPDPCRTSLGVEYFVQEHDSVWTLPDEELIELARNECAALGLIKKECLLDGSVLRVTHAYPIYSADRQEALGTIRSWLNNLTNLQLIGRNGQHRYNNQDHSMLTALRAVENIEGASHDIWDVNADEEYLERFDRH